MCGIGFLFDRKTEHALKLQRMKECLASMYHRGPDDSHIETSGSTVIGHRRLSIIDLSGSRQPMNDPSGRYTLCFNGEIYNYKDVRKQLNSHWKFTTQGDTEVLLAGLILYGTNFLPRLEGMWAFAFWDNEAQQVLLARDRIGKKPLYYQIVNNDTFACASELPALKKLTETSWQEDENSTADYLRYGYTMPGYTCWQDVYEVHPGHYAYWQPNNKLQQYAWWQLRIQNFAGNQSIAARELRTTLIEAVECRLIADVEVGAFLSGGVDSSLVCAIIRKQLNRSLKTFTIGFDEAAFDERQYARIAADSIGTDHYEEILGGWDERELERLLLEHVGQPFADSSLLPTALVSRVAAKHVKVALSGDGGDELFSGYQRYQARNILRWYTRLPKGLRSLAEKAVRALPEPTSHHSRSLIKKAHLFMDIVGRQKAETPYFAPMMFHPDQLQQLIPGLDRMGHSPPSLLEETVPDDILRMMYADALIYLPQDILVKVDRASMAHSLEARAPFLDSKVIELAFSLPRTWHRRGIKGKRLLHTTFSDLLPSTVWKRRKQGFGVPIHDWFRGKLGDHLQTLVTDIPNNCLSVPAVTRLLDEHRQKSRDHGNRLWLLYTYLLWKQRKL